MAVAGNYPIIFDEGCDLDIDWDYADDSGDPMDLTGYTAAMKAKNKIDGETSLIWTPYLTVNNPVGTISLRIPAANLVNVGFDSGVYGIKLYSPAGKVYPFLKGTVKINPEVVD